MRHVERITGVLGCGSARASPSRDTVATDRLSRWLRIIRLGTPLFRKNADTAMRVYRTATLAVALNKEPPMNHRDLVAQSMGELRLKTAAHNRLRYLSQAGWSVDQDLAPIRVMTPTPSDWFWRR